MRKLFSKSIFMMLMSAAVVFSFGSSGWSADKVVIKMASEYNEKHPTAVNGWMPWIQDLKNKTNGGLEIQFYNPNTLVPAAEMYNAVVNGSADMAVAASWRNFGVFPLDEVAAMPLLFNGSEAGSMTIWDLHQKYPEWALLKAETGGAVAVWTSSGMTYPEGQSLMNQELMRLLFNGQGLTLGEAAAEAKAATSDGCSQKLDIVWGSHHKTKIRENWNDGILECRENKKDRRNGTQEKTGQKMVFGLCFCFTHHSNIPSFQYSGFLN